MQTRREPDHPVRHRRNNHQKKILYKELNRGDRGSDYYAATLIGLFVS